MKRILNPSSQDGFQKLWFQSVSPDMGHLAIDDEHQIVEVDRKAMELLGYSDVNLKGNSLWDILCERLPAYHYQAINMAILKRMNRVIYTNLIASGQGICLTIAPKNQGIHMTVSRWIPSDSERSAH
ncbi:PAS domain-containing protein [Olivibacter sp. CPCC 100613]|uniref:PAS domain-containing protein n=1 Tax=Olivibacter sp. CPCC 100613 TaxID=3079931 RepID=UPI002FF9F7FE